MHDYPWRPIHRLTADWAALGRSAASRDAAERLAAAEPSVDELGVHDLAELVELIAPTPGLPAARRRLSSVRAAAVVRAMLRSQEVHPLVPRAILQSLIPGLVGVARRLAWGSGGEWQDGGAFFVDVLTTTWEVVTEWRGEDRPYAVLDVLSAVRCRLRRQLLAHRGRVEKYATETGNEVADGRAACTTSSDLDELARALDEARDGGLDGADAAVLYAHRVLGYSLTELSAMTGASRRHLGERKDRAVEALVG